MSDFKDGNQTAQPDEMKPVAFCQNCGKALNRDTVRVVGPAVYCEPCLAARLAGAPNADASAGAPSGYAPVGGGAASGWVATPPLPSAPNPGLAALLGFIPGVGAMYNEQYAKGIVHLVVFAVLVSLSHASGIFGLFIAGWEFYMAIEAHHTARARRDGLPLPNPFGLNDIGERLGFGKAWPQGPGVASVVQDAAQAASQGLGSMTSQTPPPGGAAAPPWGAPADSGAYAAGYAQTGYGQTGYGQTGYAAPYPNQAANQAVYPPQAGYPEAAYASPGYAPVAGTAGYAAPPYTPAGTAPGTDPAFGMPPAYGAPFAGAGLDPTLAPPRNRFPAGAVWLIGLGLVFLLTTTGLFDSFPTKAIIGFGLIGVGIWVFLRRMTEGGLGLANDGSPAYPLRVLRALRLAVWLGLLGIWFLLDSFHLVEFDHSWPLFLILAGVMTLLERLAANRAAHSSNFGGGYVPPPPASSATAVSPLSTATPSAGTGSEQEPGSNSNVGSN